MSKIINNKINIEKNKNKYYNKFGDRNENKEYYCKRNIRFKG